VSQSPHTPLAPLAVGPSQTADRIWAGGSARLDEEGWTESTKQSAEWWADVRAKSKRGPVMTSHSFASLLSAVSSNGMLSGVSPDECKSRPSGMMTDDGRRRGLSQVSTSSSRLSGRFAISSHHKTRSFVAREGEVSRAPGNSCERPGSGVRNRLLLCCCLRARLARISPGPVRGCIDWLPHLGSGR
jgi:hypothetical protein